MKLETMQRLLSLKHELSSQSASLKWCTNEIDSLTKRRDEIIAFKATHHKKYQETLEQVRILQEELGVDHEDRV